MAKETGLVTLTLVVTVREEDAEAAKEALMGAVGGDDFPEALYDTREREATGKEVEQFKAGSEFPYDSGEEVEGE